MTKAVAAFVFTLIAAFVGLILGAAINLEGYLGIFFAIATMGAFIVHSLEENSKK